MVEKALEESRNGRSFEFGEQGHCAQITDLSSKAGRSSASTPNWPCDLDQHVHLSRVSGLSSTKYKSLFHKSVLKMR